MRKGDFEYGFYQRTETKVEYLCISLHSNCTRYGYFRSAQFQILWRHFRDGNNGYPVVFCDCYSVECVFHISDFQKQNPHECKYRPYSSFTYRSYPWRMDYEPFDHPICCICSTSGSVFSFRVQRCSHCVRRGVPFDMVLYFRKAEIDKKVKEKRGWGT